MRFEYVHNLRGLAILLIILAHAIFVIPTSIDLSNLLGLMGNSSILFVTIAGFLFAAIGERYTYQGYLINKIKNVIFPYIFLSLPAALIYTLGYKTTHLWLDMDYFNQLSFIAKYAYLLVTGAHLGPLWFIPMIVIFYLFFPFFISILHITKRNLVLIFIITLCIGMYIGRPLSNDNVIQSALYFLPTYIWGIILYRTPKVIHFFKKHSLLWLVFYIISASLYYELFGNDTSTDLPIKILFSTILYSFFREYFDRRVQSFNILAQVSFYLFFIHGYFVGAIRIFLSSQSLDINEYFLITGVVSVTLFASLLSFYILKPFVGKYKRQLLGVN